MNNHVAGEFIQTNCSACNASFLTRNRKTYIIAREANYAFFNPIYGKLPDGRKNIDTDKFICSNQNVFDSNTHKLVATLYKHPRVPNSKNYGIEDIRLIDWNNKWYGFGTVPFSANDGTHAVMNTFEVTENFNIANQRELPTTHKLEKNWQPIQDWPFKLIYSYKPFMIIDVNTMQYTPIQSNKCDIAFSGSSQIVKYMDGYIGIIHTRNDDNNRQYVHFIVRFDNKMNIIAISPAFSFFGINIEFCTGIKYNIEHNELDILMSVNDQLLFKFSLTKDDIMLIFAGKFTNSSVSPSIYDTMYYYSVTNKSYFTAAGFATWSNNSKLILNALYLNQLDNIDGPDKEFIISRKYWLQQMLIKRHSSLIASK